ncbi:MAG: hypothetical protein ACRDTG_10270 [Pseudonocardiaceae bacterium]
MTAGLTPALWNAAMRWIADDIDASDRAELLILASALAGDTAAADDLATEKALALRGAVSAALRAGRDSA